MHNMTNIITLYYRLKGFKSFSTLCNISCKSYSGGHMVPQALLAVLDHSNLPQYLEIL